MKLQVEWMRPITLRDGTNQNLIYTVDLDRLPDDIAGIYVLGRRWGSQFEALYVGKASRIRGRLKTSSITCGSCNTSGMRRLESVLL